jgi:hypothetical protein
MLTTHDEADLQDKAAAIRSTLQNRTNRQTIRAERRTLNAETRRIADLHYAAALSDDFIDAMFSAVETA